MSAYPTTPSLFDDADMPTTPTAQVFDYATLTPETALALRMSAERVRIRLKRSAEDIIAIGQELQAAKARLAHGQFGTWLRAEFDMSQDTAERFVHVASRFGGDIPQIADFPTSVVYLLAMPSTPTEAIERVTSGEVPANLAAVKKAIADAKVAQEEADRLRRDAQVKQQRLQEAQQQATANAQVASETRAQLNATTARLTTLERELQTLRNTPPPEPTVVEKRVEVVPDAVRQRISQLEKDIREAQQARDALYKRTQEQSEMLRAQAEKTESAERERQINLRWNSVAIDLKSAIRKAMGSLPDPIDTQAFDATAWQHLTEAEKMITALAAQLRELHSASVVGVVDVSPRIVDAE